MTPGVKCQPELIYPNMSQRSKILSGTGDTGVLSYGCISVRVLSSGSGKGYKPGDRERVE